MSAITTWQIRALRVVLGVDQRALAAAAALSLLTIQRMEAQPMGLRLAEMLGNGPLEWEEQRGAWGFQQFIRPAQGEA